MRDVARFCERSDGERHRQVSTIITVNGPACTTYAALAIAMVREVVK